MGTPKNIWTEISKNKRTLTTQHNKCIRKKGGLISIQDLLTYIEKKQDMQISVPTEC